MQLQLTLCSYREVLFCLSDVQLNLRCWQLLLILVQLAKTCVAPAKAFNVQLTLRCVQLAKACAAQAKVCAAQAKAFAAQAKACAAQAKAIAATAKAGAGY